MKQAVEEIGAMTRSFEASGFERRQADATIRAIANSIEKFAVTPEVLRSILKEAFDDFKSEMDGRFERQESEMNARFDDHRSDTNARFDDIRADTNTRFDELRADMNQQFEAMRAEQRAESSRLFTLMLSTAMGMAGVVGAMIFDRLL